MHEGAAESDQARSFGVRIGVAFQDDRAKLVGGAA